MKYRKFQDETVKNKYASYPQKVRTQLLLIRELIFQIAAQSQDIGQIEEILKWETPSYLTYNPKSGTTIRLGIENGCNNRYSISVHCQTTLVAEFKEIHPELEYDKNRSLIFDTKEELPIETIKQFIFSALTYHYRKKHGLGPKERH